MVDSILQRCEYIWLYRKVANLRDLTFEELKFILDLKETPFDFTAAIVLVSKHQLHLNSILVSAYL